VSSSLPFLQSKSYVLTITWVCRLHESLLFFITATEASGHHFSNSAFHPYKKLFVVIIVVVILACLRYSIVVRLFPNPGASASIARPFVACRNSTPEIWWGIIGGNADLIGGNADLIGGNISVRFVTLTTYHNFVTLSM
jgi:hypothetical protein